MEFFTEEQFTSLKDATDSHDAAWVQPHAAQS